MIKRIFNYFWFKVSSSLTRIITVLAILAIYQQGVFLTLFKQPIKFNFYDILNKEFGYLSLFYSMLLFYIIITYNICARSYFHQYLFLKFESKYQVYNANIFTMLLIAVLFVLYINLITILQSFLNVSFSNTWSPYFFHIMSGNINLFYTTENLNMLTSKLTPITYIVYTEILVVLYLTFLGVVFLVSNIIIKQRGISFLLIFIINFINLFLDSSNGILGRLSFTNNIYFITASNFEIKNNLFIILRIIYWFMLIGIFYLIGRYLTKKTDYRFNT